MYSLLKRRVIRRRLQEMPPLVASCRWKLDAQARRIMNINKAKTKILLFLQCMQNTYGAYIVAGALVDYAPGRMFWSTQYD